jgi:hypothetical protein
MDYHDVVRRIPWPNSSASFAISSFSRAVRRF